MDTPPGKVIRSLRQALDMTQAEFARAAGWSASTISSWERGSTQPSRIAFKTILAFAEERGVRYQPKSEAAAAATPAPTNSQTLPVLRLGSRLPPPPLVARDSGREESFGSRRWTDLATYDLDAETEALAARPSAAERFDARFAALDAHVARPDWHVDARLQLKIGTGTGLRRAGYVAASLAALVIGLGAGALLRSGGSPATSRASIDASRAAEIDASRVARPVRAEPPPVQVDELALAAVAAPALGQPPFAAPAAAEPATPPQAAKAEMPAPSTARLESIVALGGVRRASFRVGDRSISLVEGDEIGGRSVALIGNDEVTLVGGGVAARVRLGFDTAIE
jgi:transcriptional regulator with XRE-family HTH domain